MLVSIDGGVTWVTPEENVRIRYEVLAPDAEQAILQVNATHEGLILDLIEGDGYVRDTASMTAQEIADDAALFKREKSGRVSSSDVAEFIGAYDEPVDRTCTLLASLANGEILPEDFLRSVQDFLEGS